MTQARAIIVGPVASLQAAMAQVWQDGFDVAVLDINLRGERVYPVADLLLEQRLPFVFATGYDEAFISARFAGVPRCEEPHSGADLVHALLPLCRGRVATEQGGDDA